MSYKEKLAFNYGINKELFQNNKAVIDKDEIEYEIVEESDSTELKIYSDKTVVIKNPYSLKIRLEKILSKQFEMSRAQVENLVESGMISNEQGKDLKKIIICDGLEVIKRNLNLQHNLEIIE